MNTKEWEKEFVEKGAALEHERWARWQNYLHSFLTWNNDIQMWTLPHEKKEWWDSEIRTPYHMLNEIQKESDRKEVRTYLPLIRSILSSHTQEIREKVEKMLNDKRFPYQNKCSKCSSILQKNWLPPICPECFYSDDTSKWDGVKTKESKDQYTFGYNQALDDMKSKLLQILESNE